MWLLSLLFVLTCAVDTTDDRRADLLDAVADYVAPLGLAWDPAGTHVAWTDLNRDGRDDALVYLTGRDWCGSGGCTVLVFETMDEIDAEEFGTYRPAAEISMVSGPIRAVRSRGYWSDLIVTGEHGPTVLRFDGETYPMSPGDGEPVRGRIPPGKTLFADLD